MTEIAEPTLFNVTMLTIVVYVCVVSVCLLALVDVFYAVMLCLLIFCVFDPSPVAPIIFALVFILCIGYANNIRWQMKLESLAAQALRRLADR
jgi:hypothetical protein